MAGASMAGIIAGVHGGVLGIVSNSNLIISTYYNTLMVAFSARMARGKEAFAAKIPRLSYSS